MNTTATAEPHLVIRHATMDRARQAEARLAAQYPERRFAVAHDPAIPFVNVYADDHLYA